MTTTVESATSTTRTAIDPENSPPEPCDCGSADCRWREGDIDNLIDGEGPWVTDRELRQVVQNVLGLAEVCGGFHDHVSRSIRKFTPVTRRYSRPVALHAVREASIGWHGCQEANCGRCRTTTGGPDDPAARPATAAVR